MVKGIGIEIEAEAIRVAVVDGSQKRFVLTDFKSVPIEREDSSAEGAAAAPSTADITRAIKAAMRDVRGKRENLGLAVDTSRAVIREHSLPFAGDERIRQVLKFEIEGKLPQMGIDDVIVDYYVIDESENQSKLLVAALPKKILEPQLRAAAAADCDPQVAGLSAFELFNAVAACGKVPAQGNAAFVHVLDDQILFLLTEDGALRQVRSLKGGAGTLGRNIRRELGPEATPPKLSVPAGAEDAGVDEDLLVLQDEAPPTMELARGEVGRDLAERQSRAFLSRLTRDLRRTVFSLRLQRNTPVFVSGRVNELPGFVAEMSAIFGGEARSLDLLGSLEHSLDLSGGELQDAGDRLPIALGMALHMVGADFVGTNFRQEELRFARSFDILKVPLAFALFFLFLFLALENVYLFREINKKLVPEQLHEAERAATILIDADLEYAGYSTGRQTSRDRWYSRLSSRLDQIKEHGKSGKLPGWPKIDHMVVRPGVATDDPLRMAQACNTALRDTVNKLQEDMGGAGGAVGYSMPPSTLDALWNVFEAFDAVQKQKQARLKIDSIDTRLIPASQKGTQDGLELRMIFVVFTSEVAEAAEIRTLVREKLVERGALVSDDFKMDSAGDAGYFYDLKVNFTQPPRRPDNAPAGE
ncbi:MAG: pilus assembly protein PilM [Planctomycetes bacterium]|nr:pilus assembly protein PilM [Planctomycetota bacterium]